MAGEYCKDHMALIRETAQTTQCLKDLKRTVDEMRKTLWTVCIVGGVIGGLLGKITPDFFNFLLKAAFAGQP